MASATVPYSMDIKLETGVSQTFALKFTTGKAVTSKFPGGRVMFTDLASRKLFLNDEDANEFEHALNDLRIQPADFIRVTKVKHGGRGGGFAYRVERIEDDGSEAAQRVQRSVATVSPVRQATVVPTRTEALLEKSIEQVQQRKAPSSAQAEITPAAVRLCATMCVLIDGMTEAKAYAQRRGIDLTNEDLRCLITTAFINDCKGGGR